LCHVLSSPFTLYIHKSGEKAPYEFIFFGTIKD